MNKILLASLLLFGGLSQAAFAKDFCTIKTMQQPVLLVGDVVKIMNIECTGEVPVEIKKFDTFKGSDEAGLTGIIKRMSDENWSLTALTGASVHSNYLLVFQKD